MKRLLFSGLFFVTLATADFNAQQWQLRAPLRVTSGSEVSEFSITADVFRNSSAQLRDLRILREGNSEIPYVVRYLGGNLQLDEMAVRIRDKSWTKGSGVQAVLDLRGHPEHNRLRIATTQQNFKQAVILETSDDAKQWSTVLSDGVIFDISRPEANVSDLTLVYPTSTRAYLRMTFPGWTDASFLESAWVAERKETDAIRDIIGKLQPEITQHTADQTTEVVFDLGFAGQPCDRLVLQVQPGLFSRSTEVSTSNDQKIWINRGGFNIDRTNNGEHLTVEWGETWDRYIKLTIFNADSAPLDFRSATASEIRRVVQFASKAGGNYMLYSDNAGARQPAYDFALVQEPSVPAVAASVGTWEKSPEFKGLLAPYSERKPWVLNGALGVAVAVMAFITYRFARKTTTPKV